MNYSHSGILHASIFNRLQLKHAPMIILGTSNKVSCIKFSLFRLSMTVFNSEFLLIYGIINITNASVAALQFKLVNIFTIENVS